MTCCPGRVLSNAPAKAHVVEAGEIRISRSHQLLSTAILAWGSDHAMVQDVAKQQQALEAKEAELNDLRAELSAQEREVSQRSVATAAVESRVADASSAEAAAQAATAAAQQREAEAAAAEGRARDLERSVAARESEVFSRERELRESSRQVSCLHCCC